MNKNKIENIVISRSQNKQPLIFNKKVNDNYKIIPLNTTNQLGKTKHFPPANKEWFNSIYAYNNNYIKSLPSIDKNISQLIKSYFNFFFSQSVLKSKRLRLRFRRLSLNKIFVSKAELKHTSDKVTITLFIYNEEKRLLINNIKRLVILLFPRSTQSTTSTKDNELFNNKLDFINKAKSLVMDKVEKEKLLTIDLINDISGSFDGYNTRLYNELKKIILEEELESIIHYKLLLNFNNSKFEDKSLLKLSKLISKIYGKKVEFNIVNLKTLYLNSDILTQAISLKLKNRDNRILGVLKKFLSMVKLPNINRIREKYGNGKKEQLMTRRIKDVNGNIIFTSSITEDSLNQFLLRNSPYETNISNSIAKPSSSLDDIIINSLKHKSIGGVRLEAKGRLTRRFTASRSVFKIKWKGSLKNIDSSYRGISSVMLRGHLKSNLQYSLLNSKTRNGAFGIKGWVSSK